VLPPNSSASALLIVQFPSRSHADSIKLSLSLFRSTLMQ
jgi:hypothetical protein